MVNAEKEKVSQLKLLSAVKSTTQKMRSPYGRISDARSGINIIAELATASSKAVLNKVDDDEIITILVPGNNKSARRKKSEKAKAPRRNLQYDKNLSKKANQKPKKRKCQRKHRTVTPRASANNAISINTTRKLADKSAASKIPPIISSNQKKTHDNKSIKNKVGINQESVIQKGSSKKDMKKMWSTSWTFGGTSQVTRPIELSSSAADKIAAIRQRAKNGFNFSILPKHTRTTLSNIKMNTSMSQQNTSFPCSPVLRQAKKSFSSVAPSSAATPAAFNMVNRGETSSKPEAQREAFNFLSQMHNKEGNDPKLFFNPIFGCSTAVTASNLDVNQDTVCNYSAQQGYSNQAHFTDKEESSDGSNENQYDESLLIAHEEFPTFIQQQRDEHQRDENNSIADIIHNILNSPGTEKLPQTPNDTTFIQKAFPPQFKAFRYPMTPITSTTLNSFHGRLYHCPGGIITTISSTSDASGITASTISDFSPVTPYSQHSSTRRAIHNSTPLPAIDLNKEFALIEDSVAVQDFDFHHKIQSSNNGIILSGGGSPFKIDKYRANINEEENDLMTWVESLDSWKFDGKSVENCVL